jgi:hypothetical protein
MSVLLQEWAAAPTPPSFLKAQSETRNWHPYILANTVGPQGTRKVLLYGIGALCSFPRRVPFRDTHVAFAHRLRATCISATNDESALRVPLLRVLNRDGVSLPHSTVARTGPFVIKRLPPD